MAVKIGGVRERVEGRTPGVMAAPGGASVGAGVVVGKGRERAEVGKAEFGTLSAEQQKQLKVLGPERFQRVFEATNVQVGEGEWIDKKVFSGLPENHQTYLKEKGVTAYKEWTGAAQTAMAGYVVGEGQYDVVKAVEGGVSDDTLTALGISAGDVKRARDRVAAEGMVGEYKTSEGSYNVVSAVMAGVDPAVFVGVGVSEGDVNSASDLAGALKNLGVYASVSGEVISVDLGGALEAGVASEGDIEELVRAGLYTGSQVNDAKRDAAFFKAMKPYKVGEGFYNVAAALKGGVGRSALERHFGKEAVDEARESAKAESTLDKYRIEGDRFDVGKAYEDGVSEDLLVSTFGSEVVAEAKLISQANVVADKYGGDLAMAVAKGENRELLVRAYGEDQVAKATEWYGDLSPEDQAEFKATGDISPKVEFVTKKGETKSIKESVWKGMSLKGKLAEMGYKDPTVEEYVAVYLDSKGFGNDPDQEALDEGWAWYYKYPERKWSQQWHAGWKPQISGEWKYGELRWMDDKHKNIDPRGKEKYEAYKKSRGKYADAAFAMYKEDYGVTKALREWAIMTVSDLGMPAVRVVRKEVGFRDISAQEWALTGLSAVAWGTSAVTVGLRVPVVAKTSIGKAAVKPLSVSAGVGAAGKFGVVAVKGVGKVVGAVPFPVPKIGVGIGEGGVAVTVTPVTFGGVAAGVSRGVASASGVVSRGAAGVGRVAGRVPTGLERVAWTPAGEQVVSSLRLGEAVTLGGAAVVGGIKTLPVVVRAPVKAVSAGYGAGMGGATKFVGWAESAIVPWKLPAKSVTVRLGETGGHTVKLVVPKIPGMTELEAATQLRPYVAELVEQLVAGKATSIVTPWGEIRAITSPMQKVFGPSVAHATGEIGPWRVPEVVVGADTLFGGPSIYTAFAVGTSRVGRVATSPGAVILRAGYRAHAYPLSVLGGNISQLRMAAGRFLSSGKALGRWELYKTYVAPGMGRVLEFETIYGTGTKLFSAPARLSHLRELGARWAYTRVGATKIPIRFMGESAAEVPSMGLREMHVAKVEAFRETLAGAKRELMRQKVPTGAEFLPSTGVSRVVQAASEVVPVVVERYPSMGTVARGVIGFEPVSISALYRSVIGERPFTSVGRGGVSSAVFRRGLVSPVSRVGVVYPRDVVGAQGRIGIFTPTDAYRDVRGMWESRDIVYSPVRADIGGGRFDYGVVRTSGRADVGWRGIIGDYSRADVGRVDMGRPRVFPSYHRIPIPFVWLPGAKGEEEVGRPEALGQEMLWERLPVVEEALFFHFPTMPTAPIVAPLEPRRVRFWDEDILRRRKVYKKARLGRARIVRKRAKPEVRTVGKARAVR